MTVTTLGYTGAVQTYTVPSGVTYVTLQAWGAAGSPIAFNRGTGGLGGYSKGILICAPGTVLYVNVGGSEASTGWPGGGAGGSGTNPGGMGGGYSSVQLAGSPTFAIVAGGGGGHGGQAGWGWGGNGGGASGGDGVGTVAGGPGAGGTQTAGYARGQGAPGTPGGTGAGGGGGGGGYFGGGAGHNGSLAAGAGGGGGGSGFLSSALYPGATMQNGVRSGHGQVVITAVNNPPLAPTLTGPANNGYIINTEANDFTWAYNNVDPGDYQSAADFQYKKFGDAGWTTLTNVATTVPSYTLPASTWVDGFQYEWQVKAYGAFGAASPWSSSRFTNTIASVPAPTITTPTSGDMEFGTPVELDWTLPGAFTQDAYRVQRADLADGSGVIYYDSGIVALTALSAQIPLDAAAGRTDWLRVQFRYNAHWSAWASVDILDEFGPPKTPLLLLAQVPDRPEVVVTITNPPGSLGYADTILNDLYRDGVRIAANLPPNSSFTDLLPGAGNVSYTVTAYAASGGTATSF